MKLAIGALFVTLAVCSSGCHVSQPFVFHVKFKQPVELKPGAEVRMAGVPIGEVEHVAISQQSEDAPPTVDVQVSIKNPKVRVRKADSFHVETVGLLGEAYLEIDPAHVQSPPIPNGSLMAGKQIPSFSFSPDWVDEVQPFMEIARKLAALPPSERKLMIEQFTKLLDKAPKNPSHRKAGPPRNGAK